MMWAAVTLIYVFGLAFFALGDNAASNNPGRFWLALILWPITLLAGITSTLLNRMLGNGR